MEKIEKFVAHGYQAVCNLGGYEIQLSKDFSFARFSFFGTEPTEWIEIEFDSNDEPYCDTKRGRQYLSDYMRIR